MESHNQHTTNAHSSRLQNTNLHYGHISEWVLRWMVMREHGKVWWMFWEKQQIKTMYSSSIMTWYQADVQLTQHWFDTPAPPVGHNWNNVKSVRCLRVHKTASWRVTSHAVEFGNLVYRSLTMTMSWKLTSTDCSTREDTWGLWGHAGVCDRGDGDTIWALRSHHYLECLNLLGRSSWLSLQLHRRHSALKAKHVQYTQAETPTQALVPH